MPYAHLLVGAEARALNLLPCAGGAEYPLAGPRNGDHARVHGLGRLDGTRSPGLQHGDALGVASTCEQRTETRPSGSSADDEHIKDVLAHDMGSLTQGLAHGRASLTTGTRSRQGLA